MKIIYLIYALKKTDYNKLIEFIKYVKAVSKKTNMAIVIDLLKDFFKYNTLFLDYFYFRFFERDLKEKETYIDTLSMYVFQKRFNNKKYVKYFADKLLFYTRFAQYVRHEVHPLESLGKLNQWIYKYKPDGIVCKNNLGQVGSNIEVYKVEIINNQIKLNGKDLYQIYKHLKINKLNLIEEKINQHKILNEIYPHSLNTVRVITFLEKSNEVKILGSILRIGYDKKIDNFDAGGISVVIDNDGIIRKNAVIKNPVINKTFDKHPLTNESIVGVKIPYWNRVIDLVNKAAREITEVRTVGWDVVITDSGVSLLEGNHNWDKTHWQLCYGKGMKEYIEELNSYVSN